MSVKYSIRCITAHNWGMGGLGEGFQDLINILSGLLNGYGEASD